MENVDNFNYKFPLGKIQKSILILLWDSERYGLEILTKLKFSGINITTSQLYPALSKLETNKLLKSRTEIRKGANRKYYTITELGKKTVNEFVENTFSIVAELIVNRTDDYYSLFKDLIQIKEGNSLLNLNEKTSDDLIIDLSQLVGSKGIHYCVNFILDQDVFDDRLGSLELNNVRSISYKNNCLSLKDKTCDVIIALFFFHASSYYSIFSELKRVLKEDGLLYIIDIDEIKNNILLDLITSLINDHPVFGIDLGKLKGLLNNMHMEIVKEKSRKGLIFLEVKNI